MASDMRCIEIAEPGGPEVLRLTRRPRPRPADDEVLLRVICAGVNRPDVLQRQGNYPPPPGASDIPGLEVAGEVTAVGTAVQTLREGDRVCALVTGGGYAQYCVAHESLALPVPEGVDACASAGIPETTFTVWTNVFERGRLAPGETLLVHGGSSGIGTTAIQLAHAWGARVFVTAGNERKAAACRELGAEAAIDYRGADFVAELRELTGGRGVDLILDMVGGDYLPRNLELLAEDGRLVQIAFLRGAQTNLDLSLIMRKRLTVTGSTLRARPVKEKARIARALRERVWPLFASGEVRPIVHASYPLAEAAEAHAAMERSEHIGKLLLDAREG